MTRGDNADVQRLLDQWAKSQPAEQIPEDALGKIRAAIAPSLEFVRPLPSQPALAARVFLVSLACSFGLTMLVGTAGVHLMTPLQMVLMTGILTTASMLLSFGLAARMVPGSRQRVWFDSVIVLSGLGIGVAFMFPWRSSTGFIADGWPCGITELAIALPVVGAFWLVARRGVLCASAGLGVALTGVAAFLALIPLQFQCMFQQAPHLLVWHVGAACLFIGLGALVGYRLRL